MHGFKIKYIINNQEYWLYKICYNQQPLAREPIGYIYRCASTTIATLHLEKKHRINQHGFMPTNSPTNT
jgi:hypothetical protein